MNRTTILVTILFAITTLSMAGATQFSVINAAWGTQNMSSVNPLPGQHSVPLTITMQNLLCDPLKNVTLTLSTWSTNFTFSNGQNSDVQSISNVGPNQQFKYTFYVNVPSGISPGTYNLPAQVTWESTNNQFLNCTAPLNAYYYINTPINIVIPVYFNGNPNLQYKSQSLYLTPGQINNVTLYVSNIGFGNASDVQTNVALQGIQNSKIGILEQPNTIPYLAAGATKPVHFSISIPSNFTGLLLPLNLTSTFANGTTSSYQHLKSTLNLLVQSNIPIMITENETVTNVGAITQLSIGITNNEKTPIYSVEATLSQQNASSSSMSVTKGNPSYYSIIEPNQTVWFRPSVTTSPSATEGGYNTKLSISYQDSAGSMQTLNYNIGVVVVARLAMVQEGVSVYPESVNSSLFAVSGSLIDEGSGNAYYAEVYATLMRNNTIISQNSTYVGEVLTNSPTAFSLLLNGASGYSSNTNIAAQSSNAIRRSANSIGASNTVSNSISGKTAFSPTGSNNLKVKVYVVYQNDLGNVFTTNSTTYNVSGSFFAGAISSLSQYYTHKSSGTPIYVYVIIIIAIIAAFVFLYKKYWGKKAKEQKEPKQKSKERKVI